MDHTQTRLDPKDNKMEKRRRQNRLAQQRFRERNSERTKVTSVYLPGTQPTVAVGVTSTESTASHIPFFADEDFDSLLAGCVTGSPATVGDCHDYQGQDRATETNTMLSMSTDQTPDIGTSKWLGMPLSPSFLATAQQPLAICERTDHGSGANWSGPLYSAVQKGNARIVKMLARLRCDCNESDRNGVTPLMVAIMKGYEDIFSILIENGASIAETDSEGRSAIHLAVLYRRTLILRRLLEHSDAGTVKIDAHDAHGRTALHLAIESDFDAGVEILLHRGANVWIKSRNDSFSSLPTILPQ